MKQTTNNSIKIVRLQSGEDIIADYIEKNDDSTVVLDKPMHIIFKRLPPSGRTVLMLMPWLPIEIIKENIAIIYMSNILTTIEPNEDLIKHYVQILKGMEERKNISPGEREGLELDEEDLIQFFTEKNKQNLH
jgi:hypothetical protein